MEIREINTLQGLREVFIAPEEKRHELFMQKIIEPMRPLLEQSMRYMPSSPEGDPMMVVARTMKLYTPDMGAEPALAALDELERAVSYAERDPAFRFAVLYSISTSTASRRSTTSWVTASAIIYWSRWRGN